jgi:hypothetical protein
MGFQLFFLHKIIKDGKPGSGRMGQEKAGSEGDSLTIAGADGETILATASESARFGQNFIEKRIQADTHTVMPCARRGHPLV